MALTNLGLSNRQHRGLIIRNFLQGKKSPAERWRALRLALNALTKTPL